MKKAIITLIATLGLAVGTTAIAAAASATAAAKLPARSTMVSASSASSGFAPKCPPPGVVARFLGQNLFSTPGVTIEANSVFCWYTAEGHMPNPNIQWMNNVKRAEFNLYEKLATGAEGAVVVNDLGKGVVAYWVPPVENNGPYVLDVLKGAVLCTISAKVSPAHLTPAHLIAMAKELLKSYW
jgi:hypothetical protein